MGFWHIVFKSDYDNLRSTTTNKFKIGVEYAYLDDELFNLLQNESSREELVESLISAWFADNTSEIEKITQIN